MCLYVYACFACVWAHICGYMCTCACGSPRLMSGIILFCSSTSFIEAASVNQTQSSPILLILIADLRWSFLAQPSETGITGWGLMCAPSISVHSGDPNSALQSFLGKLLTSKPSPQPLSLCVIRTVIPRSMIHSMNLGEGVSA